MVQPDSICVAIDSATGNPWVMSTRLLYRVSYSQIDCVFNSETVDRQHFYFTQYQTSSACFPHGHKTSYLHKSSLYSTLSNSFNLYIITLSRLTVEHDTLTDAPKVPECFPHSRKVDQSGVPCELAAAVDVQISGSANSCSKSIQHIHIIECVT